MYVHGGQETGGLLTERYTFVDEVAPTSPETSFLFGGGGFDTFIDVLLFVICFTVRFLQLMVCSSCGRKSELLTGVKCRVYQHG